MFVLCFQKTRDGADQSPVIALGGSYGGILYVFLILSSSMNVI